MKASPILLESTAIGVYTRGGSFHPTPPGLPHEMRVSADVWRVLYHDRVYISPTARRPLLGVAIPLHRVLVADPTVPGYELLDTVIHEWSHAVVAMGRRQDRRIAKLSKDAEEALAELFARELVRSGWRP